MRIFDLVAPALLLAACVSDTPVYQAPDAGAQDSSMPPVDSGPKPDANMPDTGTTCAPNTADCDPMVPGCETNLLASDQNCGACGHDCGGAGLCKAGVCSAMVIADKVSAPQSLAVSGLSVYWNVDQQLERCPITGCPGAPSDMADGTALPKYGGTAPSYVAADATSVYWVGYTTDSQMYSIYTCPLAGCTYTQPVPFYSYCCRADEMVANTGNLYWLDPPNSAVTRVRKSDKSTATLGGTSALTFPGFMAADDAHFLITDGNIPVNGGGLYVCDTADDCAKGLTRLLDRGQHVATNGKTAFTNQLDSNSIVGCDLAGCSGSGNVLATGEKGVSVIAADATNVYWAIRGSGSAPDGTIRACTLPDCKGGPRTLAYNQAAPRDIVLDASFVYWLDQGTGAPNSGQIVRIRK